MPTTKGFKNKSGIYPTRDLVLIEPEEDVQQKKGIIIIPDAATERERLAQIFGHIVEIGDVAFKAWDVKYGTDIHGKMKPGTRILFAKYHGVVVKGKDGRDYRLIEDSDVAAIVDADLQKVIDS